VLKTVTIWLPCIWNTGALGFDAFDFVHILTGGVQSELWWGDLMERDHLEDLGTDGRVLLKWIVQKWNEEAWTGLIWRKTRTGGGLCECGDGPSASIKCVRFRD